MKTFKQYQKNKSEKDSWLTSKRQQFWNAMDEKKKREDVASPKKTVDYEGHDYYGTPKKKVLARKSPSSSGGSSDGSE